MINKILERVIGKKQKGHILFDHQEGSDLHKLAQALEETGEIVIDFNPIEWHDKVVAVVLVKDIEGIIIQREKKEKLEACRKYIATKLLTELEKKYPEVKQYEGSSYLPIFLEGDRQEYEAKRQSIYSLEDVEEILEVEGIILDRVHFIMNGTRSDTICDSLSILLSDKTPFKVSIYCSPNGFYTYRIPDATEKIFLDQVYNYTRYDKFQKGKRNNAVKPHKKGKTHEKVQENIY